MSLRHPVRFIEAIIDTHRARVQLREIEENRAAMEHLYGIKPDTFNWWEAPKHD